ncbi:LysR family transcriptional regulator [Candidatus Thioglobus sp.]|nr:LysR family transcriptional regulator [Candidatus Thioglobus sp.]MDA8872117.1 LysR family transcriptional regulator [Candidatus Thioglobus sp.]
MAIPYKHHDTLRLFIEVAQYLSFSDAAEELHMTKGAISYQIKTLEADLGFKVFVRSSRGILLTEEGHQLLKATRAQFLGIETKLEELKGQRTHSLTVGMSSYFASRWLSPRLMSFMQLFPDIQLRIQPMTQLFDLERQGVDVAIRWGNGAWDDVEITPFLTMPAWPTGNSNVAKKVKTIGLERAFSELTLLRDHDDSTAWSDWHKAAGLSHQMRKENLAKLPIFEFEGDTFNLALDKVEFIETGSFKLEREEEYLMPYQLHKGFINGKLKAKSNGSKWFNNILVYKHDSTQEQKLVINVDTPRAKPLARHKDSLEQKCGSKVMEWGWLSFISQTNDIKSATNQQCIYDYFKEANDKEAFELFQAVLGGTDSILDYLETNVEK